MKNAIQELREFAHRRPGLDYANYGEPKSYRAELRSIAKQLREFNTALSEALTEGVTEAQIIEASKTAFSGRLTWVSKDFLREKHGLNTDYTPRWDYCTGQYFPTEYRAAATAVVKEALNILRQSRPKVTAEIKTIAQLKQISRDNGGHWFDRDSMRFFNSRIESGIIRGRLFISSEQHDTSPRRYSVRSFDKEGNIDTVGEFQQFATREAAIEFAKSCPLV